MMVRYDSLTVVIPTLNEGETIAPLIRGITSSYPGSKVIVSDDGSKDGTIEMVSRLARNRVGLSLINRKALGRRSGLTASVIDGIAASKTELVVVMDGDMQHPYKLIGDVVSSLKSADLAICVRSKIKNWPLHRRIVSRMAVWSGLFVLSVRRRHSSKDIMSGFFGVRKQMFMRVYESNSRRFVGEGFKVLFDFLKSADRSIKIAELPYSFRDRQHGASNAKPVHGLYLLISFIR